MPQGYGDDLGEDVAVLHTVPRVTPFLLQVSSPQQLKIGPQGPACDEDQVLGRHQGLVEVLEALGTLVPIFLGICKSAWNFLVFYYFSKIE